MRFRIQQSRPGNLNKAIKLAVELEAYNRPEHNSHLRATLAEAGEDINSLSAMLTKLTYNFDKLQRDVNEVKGPFEDLVMVSGLQQGLKCQGTWQNERLCLYCHKPGHLRRDCLLLKKANGKRTDKPNIRQSAKSTEKQNVTQSSVGANSIGTKSWNVSEN